MPDLFPSANIALVNIEFSTDDSAVAIHIRGERAMSSGRRLY
jgi:hypothetical protein